MGSYCCIPSIKACFQRLNNKTSVVEAGTAGNATEKGGEVEKDDNVTSWCYMEDLPEDRQGIHKAWRLLRLYSRIPKRKLEGHVRDVRERAWVRFPNPCVGRWRFLDLYLTGVPEYNGILASVKDGAIFIDAGCFFGQVLRQLAFDGAPPQNLVGVDVCKEYLDFGYDLFKDRERFRGRFVIGDMLKADDEALRELDGTADVVHASSLFHLFNWNDQVRIGERIVRLMRPEIRGMVLGRQAGARYPENFEKRREYSRYYHNQDSLRRLWEEIGDRTGTKWAVWAEMTPLQPTANVPQTAIRFVIVRI